MLRFEVKAGSWGCDEGTFEGGLHELEDASPALRRLVAHAAAADPLAVVCLEGGDDSEVESDEDSLCALAEAQGEWVEPVRDPATGRVVKDGFYAGPWAEGQAINAKLDAENRAKPEVVSIEGADVGDLHEVLGEES